MSEINTSTRFDDIEKALKKLVEEDNISSIHQINELRAGVESVVANFFDQLAIENISAYSQPVQYIRASTVRIMVNDETGRRFERELPLGYEETDNGIILSGENLQAMPSTIVFLSQTGLEKIRDLHGKGADAPRCK